MLELIDAIVAVIGKVGGVGLGRTALQKIIYFLKAKGLTDAEYYAYYYGPYSAEVKGTLSTLVAYGFVDEKMGFIPGGPRIYKYTLTQDGMNLLHKKIERETKAEVEQVEAVVQAIEEYSSSLGAVDLSVPAKSYFVLIEEYRKKGKPIPTSAIQQAAGNLGWDVDDPQIEKSLNLLRKLKLVETTKSTQ